MTTETTPAARLADIIERIGLSMTATPAAHNPNMIDPPGKGASHWLCVITREGWTSREAFAVPFTQGAAYRRWNAEKIRRYHGTYTRSEIARLSPVIGGRGLGGAPESIALRELREECSEPTPPTLEAVLRCLAMDALGYDNARNFDEWASEYGYDTDSRKAEKTYRVIGEQAKELRVVLGSTNYDELLRIAPEL